MLPNLWIFLLTQIPGLEKFVGTEYFQLMQKELNATLEKKNHQEHKNLVFYICININI
jgi:hypothetical protein